MDIDESISGDAHRNLLREALMPSDEDAFWESFLEHVTSHQNVAEEDVQDIGKPSLWAVVVTALAVRIDQVVLDLTTDFYCV